MSNPETIDPRPRLTPETETILAILRLSRALKRCPPEQGERPFPPAVGRMLGCVRANPGVSSRDLCDLLDLRPSSLSEMLTRAEKEGWITRVPDEGDKRMQHVSLSEKGLRLIDGIDTARDADAVRKTACFTPEEKAQMIALCNRLSAHLEELSLDAPPFSPDREKEDSEPWPEDRRPRRKGPPHGLFPRRKDPPPAEEDAEPQERPPFPHNGRFRC